MTTRLDPAPPAHRWAALGLISLAMFASSYVYDSVGPMAKVLADQLRFSDGDIGLLQAVCSLPNIFMVLLGGVVLDRIGVRKAFLLFALLCCGGAVLTAVGPAFATMLAGRLLFGLGIGCLSVAANTGIAMWFSTERLSFVFGLTLTISRLGSLVAQLGPSWAPGTFAGWRGPLVIAAAFGVLTLLAAVAYGVLEARVRRHHALAGTPTAEPGDGRDFGPAYRWAVLICVAFYAGIFPFQTFAQKFFVEARHATPGHAAMAVGLVTVIAMVTTPFFGLLADRIGRRPLLLVLGCALLVPVFPLLALPTTPLVIPMLLMGLAFSLVPAVLWPAVMLIVPGPRLGRAFGLMSMVQSIGLTGFNLLVGWANDVAHAGPSHPEGYLPGLGLFTVGSLAALGFAWALWRHERGPARHGLEFATGTVPAQD